MSAPLDVLHEDDDVLVVDKPAGLVCHPTKGDEWSSLIGRVRLHLGNGEGRLVNRLDRETSGVVLIAKHRDAASELGALLAREAVDKSYVAIVHGHVDGARVIDAPLGRDEQSPVAIKDCVRSDGAPARTRIAGARPFARDGASFSILEIAPETGRKHQIRIHLAHIGHPIVGDKLYGHDEQCYLRFVSGALTDDDRRALRLPFHALHAQQLSLVWRGRPWSWRATLPAMFRDFAG
ncbi:MAG TPA: RluA family pseudouridine synthase [Vicinamibacterales bacterium]|nr:RluA family pseudouridine synthase [Vicinamibacterales bacterium]